MIRRPLRLLGLITAMSSTALVSGCASQMKQNPFDPAGPVIRMQLSLLTLSLWFAIGIGLVVAAALLFVVFRFRHKPGDTSLPKQVHGSTFLEITWTLIPIVILAIVGVPTVRTAFATKQSADPNALQVRVVAHQWWWEFQYPGLGIVTGNELFIPVGKDVAVTLDSADVIHSFWIPKLAGKMDVIPGHTNHMWFNAERPELFFGQCAEFCGTSHANMRFRVNAVSPAEFDAWVKTRKAGAVTPTDPDTLAGMQLFMGTTDKKKANCISCHTIDGTAAKGKVGPNLSNIGARSTIAAGVLENNDAFLKQWITNPPAVKPGVTMPAHPNLSKVEMDQLVKYLRSLK